METIDCAIVGGGPAGLMAAERLAAAGQNVTVFDRMPSVGRKFLLAGRGGLNITHTEPLERFVGRYGEAAGALTPALQAFGPQDLRDWCAGLGEATTVGSSGRVFPASFKATPLLRAWLRRLSGLGVSFRVGHRWIGWDAAGALRFETAAGEIGIQAGATLLAMGGASWPRLGSDGAWADILRADGVAVAPLRASNVGVVRTWSEHFRERFAGSPLKRLIGTVGPNVAHGEAVVTATGLEGGLIYALGRPIREALERDGVARLTLDLRPDLDEASLQRRMGGPGISRANAWRRAGLSPAAAGLLRETGGSPKRVVLELTGLAPIARAISTAGGVRLDPGSALPGRPGVFVAGEMLDWDAPTGGYLMQACFSTGWQVAGTMLATDQVGGGPAGQPAGPAVVAGRRTASKFVKESTR